MASTLRDFFSLGFSGVVFPEEDAVVPDVVSAGVWEDVLSVVSFGAEVLHAQSAKISARMAIVS